MTPAGRHNDVVSLAILSAVTLQRLAARACARFITVRLLAQGGAPDRPENWRLCARLFWPVGGRPPPAFGQSVLVCIFPIVQVMRVWILTT